MAHSRENNNLWGHEGAEKILLDSFNGGKLPHAWLITGPRGIGKATLAYRFAKFLLSNPTPDEGNSLFGDEISLKSLEINEDSPTVSRVVSGSHADLMVLEPKEEEGKREIPIDDVRKLEHFLSLSPSESDWRMVVIDSVDDMNRNSANALLKLLEEPPKKTVLLLVSHQPGKLLPTIRSRCRFLRLKPLDETNVKKIVEASDGIPNPIEAEFASLVSDGSPGFAMEIYNKNGYRIYGDMIEILSYMPELNLDSILKFASKFDKKEEAGNWRIATYMFGWFIASTIGIKVSGNQLPEFFDGENALRQQILDNYPIDQLTNLWENLSHITSESDGLNLDKKIASIEMFGNLRQAV